MHRRAVASLLHVQYINVDLYVTGEYPGLAQVTRIRICTNLELGTQEIMNYREPIHDIGTIDKLHEVNYNVSSVITSPAHMWHLNLIIKIKLQAT